MMQLLQLPGTGKSYIVEALAGEASQSTFFSVSAADFVSKYQGVLEIAIKQLFDTARQKKPSIIFIDQIDSIMSSKSDDDADGLRRLQAQLSIEMDGLASTDSNSGIFIVAASNTPYNLDVAFLRRFDKLIYVPLPDARTRQAMFKKYLSND